MASLRQSSSSPLYPLPVRSLLAVAVYVFVVHLSAANQLEGERPSLLHRRALLGFKETPSGGNTTFDCTPSGACVPCQYSEKFEAKYRCSETGYRIPLKCIKTETAANEAKDKKKAETSRSNLEVSGSEAYQIPSSQRRTLADSAGDKAGDPEAYLTYRSCIPAVNEEKLSVLGFEVLMLGLLLASGSVVFSRRKRTVAAAGASAGSGGGGIRMQTNPRF